MITCVEPGLVGRYVRVTYVDGRGAPCTVNFPIEGKLGNVLRDWCVRTGVSAHDMMRVLLFTGCALWNVAQGKVRA